MYTLNYVFDSELKADSPPESAGILEFRLIPADSPWNTRIPGGISGGMKSIGSLSTWLSPTTTVIKPVANAHVGKATVLDNCLYHLLFNGDPLDREPDHCHVTLTTTPPRHFNHNSSFMPHPRSRSATSSPNVN